MIADQPQERRRHPRWPYAGDVVVLGLRDPKSGSTVDVSMGGAKIDLRDPVDDPIAGQPCAIRFLSAGAELLPHYVVGTVQRLERHEAGAVVAVQFTRPLDVLEVGGGVIGTDVLRQ